MTHAISPEGLALVQLYEGFQPEPQPYAEGAYVVGYGHVRVGQAGSPVTEQEAAGLLSIDLAPIERMVNANVTARLTQSQFDALVSFAVSIGADAFVQSQVLRRVNDADHIGAACAMDAWRKAELAGELEVSEALVRRRAAEKALYLRDLPHWPSPSAFVRARLDYAASVLGAPAGYDHQPRPFAALVVDAPVAATPAQRLTEILRAEPQTEALLLTQVVAEGEAVEADEIVTAHAKPAARKIEPIVPALPIDRRIKQLRARAFKLPSVNLSQSVESIGLGALMLFGLGLTLVGGSVLYSAEGETLQLAAAAAFATPGLLAVLLAGAGFLRSGVKQAAA